MNMNLANKWQSSCFYRLERSSKHLILLGLIVFDLALVVVLCRLLLFTGKDVSLYSSFSTINLVANYVTDLRVSTLFIQELL